MALIKIVKEIIKGTQLCMLFMGMMENNYSSMIRRCFSNGEQQSLSDTRYFNLVYIAIKYRQDILNGKIGRVLTIIALKLIKRCNS